MELDESEDEDSDDERNESDEADVENEVEVVEEQELESEKEEGGVVVDREIPLSSKLNPPPKPTELPSVNEVLIHDPS